MNSTRPSDELHDEFEALGPYAEQMKTIQGGFGRVMTRLTEVFGVSRQTLYNWLAGEAPKEQHREKLAQLARAAEEFIRQEFKPNAASLERTLVDGKSLLELIQDGAEGVDVARRLIAIERRGAEARSRIDELLAGAPVAAGEPGDFGLPSFDEAF
jgi:transcriptional regulator with XRE-family HTH domain